MYHNVQTTTLSGIFPGAHDVDASGSIFIEKTINYITNTTNVPEHAVTPADVPRLIHELTDIGGEHDSRISAAKDLLRIMHRAGPDHIAIAVLNAKVLPQLVAHLSHSDALMQYTIGIFASILRFPQTWDAALDNQAISLLMARLTDSKSVFETQLYAAWALANITVAERAKQEAIEVGAIPVLVNALGHATHALRKMAARAMRNITSSDAGRRAAYASNAVQPLVALLPVDSRPIDAYVQVDAVKALTFIASLGKAARKTIKSHGAVAKLKCYSNPPMELQVMAWALRDKLR